MPSKTIPMSVRLSEDDADFIAKLKIDGAATPSEKLRNLITEARQHHEGMQDYSECLALLHGMMAPAARQIREAQHDAHTPSELLATVLEWLPGVMAFLITHQPEQQPAASPAKVGKSATGDPQAYLRDMEQGAADRLFTLMESVLRLGVTKHCRGADPDVVRDRLAPILELAEVIEQSQTRQAAAK